MKSFDNTIKPTQKPVCFSVQELLSRYKSASKESMQCQPEFQELFQTIQTDISRSLEAPDSRIIEKNLKSEMESAEITINHQQVKEIPLTNPNDVLLQINHLHSIFKYLQQEEENSKTSTTANSQHSDMAKQNNEKQDHISIPQITKQTAKQQIRKQDQSPNKLTNRFNNCVTTKNNNISYQKSKSPFHSPQQQQLTPKIIKRVTPSSSPFRKAKENVSTQNQKSARTDHSANKQNNNQKQKPIENQHHSYIVIDFTKCPTQRVLIKQGIFYQQLDSNRPSMKVELSLKSLIQKAS